MSIRSVAAERGLQWLVAGWKLFLKAPGVWLGITVVLLIAMMLIGSVFASYRDIYGQATSSEPADAALA